MALAEAWHAGILRIVAKVLLGERANFSGRNRELERTFERIHRRRFFLGSLSLFSSLFNLFFSHCFDLY